MILKTFRIVLYYNDIPFDRYCTPLDFKITYCKQKVLHLQLTKLLHTSSMWYMLIFIHLKISHL